MMCTMARAFALLLAAHCAIILASAESQLSVPGYVGQGLEGFEQQAETIEQAIELGATEQLLDLLKEGVEANKPCSGVMPLTRAAYRGNVEIVTQLLNHEAELTYQDERGMDALVAAALGKHRAVVAFLLRSGAKLPSKQQLHLLYKATEQAKRVPVVSEEPDQPAHSMGNGISVVDFERPHSRDELRKAVSLISECASPEQLQAVGYKPRKTKKLCGVL